MKSIKNFIEKTIENHLLDIEHENYSKLEVILNREELKKLSFYLESNQEEKFNLLLEKLLLDKEIKTEIETLLEEEISKEPIEKGEMNPNGEFHTVFLWNKSRTQ